jgi:molybdopterin-guanine dinucleotide biosynthesis protein B
MPFVIAITGKSDAGKTFLIKGLIPEMKRRGYKVAVVKNCPHSFCFDSNLLAQTWLINSYWCHCYALQSETQMAPLLPVAKIKTGQWRFQ